MKLMESLIQMFYHNDGILGDSDASCYKVPVGMIWWFIFQCTGTIVASEWISLEFDEVDIMFDCNFHMRKAFFPV